MENYLKASKKETKMGAKYDLLDEKEADPVTWTLLKLILKWIMEAGSMLIRTFFLIQWNYMAQLKNIWDLAYHIFTTSDDYSKMRYDKMKADQDDEKIKVNHMYTNPFNHIVCPSLGLSVWFTLGTK